MQELQDSVDAAVAVSEAFGVTEWVMVALTIAVMAYVIPKILQFRRPATKP